ncbi:hypothetical protein HYPSUDRAFT_199807 [Hypholoma sublateritium FD-334 SS-4]|uniref:Beta-lactamase-related domain-containing protein n=1 Tax=Hypholoma sublateritium (strain FD-334 SS-4) TaxID=945553 RepID=A0A0D2P2X7_HYPSF|nr:hypothetical protein HYPSUDRAFT_199807 [Hypholoma sublateritium FD-334 SS-4]
MATFSPSGKRALDNFIKNTVESGTVPGFVVGVANVDGEIYFQGGGSTTAANPTSDLTVNADSVFWICSQTKMITALAVLKLIDGRKLTLETPLGDFLPEFRNPVIVDKTSTLNTTFRPATTVLKVKHLLNFSSGLFYPVIKDDLTSLPEAYTSKEMHASSNPLESFYRILIGPLPGIPLKFEPGTDFVYGFSSDALGFLVEKVSGKTLGQFCKEEIFDPLGMESCSFHLTPQLKQRFVELAYRNEDGRLVPWSGQIGVIEQDPEKVRLHLGGVGMYSSMRDYLKLLRHILQINAGRLVPNALFKAETVHQLFVPALTDKGSESLSAMVMIPGTQWGTATAIATEDSPQRRKQGSIWWGGWAGTEHFIDPESGIAVVFGVQVVPVPDMKTISVRLKLEALIYAALSTSEKL